MRPQSPTNAPKAGDNLALEAVAIPVDLVAGGTGRAKDLEQGKASIAGLMAIGASYEEAFASLAKSFTVPDLIQISAMAPTGIDRMRVLYEVQKGVKDKKAFGQMCLEAGFNPVGVALVAARLTKDGTCAESSVARAKGLIRGFGVDVWLDEGDYLGNGRLVLSDSPDDISKMSNVPLYVSCHVAIDVRSEGSMRDLPWLVEVGGDLEMKGCLNVRLTGLKEVRGTLDGSRSMGLSLLSLAEVRGKLEVARSDDFLAPNLVVVGDDLKASRSRAMCAPKLQTVNVITDLESAIAPDLSGLEETGLLHVNNAEGVVLPKLRRVSSIIARDSVGLTLPLVETVDVLNAQDARNLFMPGLKTGRALDLDDSKNVSLPNLVRLDGVLSVQGSVDCSVPGVLSVGTLYVAGSTRPDLSSLSAVRQLHGTLGDARIDCLPSLQTVNGQPYVPEEEP